MSIIKFYEALASEYLNKKKETESDQRIKLDLDDGVKVNYGKFENLLAEVKAITGVRGES